MQSKDLRLATERDLENSIGTATAPLDQRLEDLEVSAGFTPGDINDTTAANLIRNPNSETATELSAAIDASFDASIVPVQHEMYRPAYPSEDWVHLGDSMTAGGWPSMLAALTGRSHINAGIGSQKSDQIAARQGALPATLIGTVTLPASGGTPLGLTPNPTREGVQYAQAGSLGGVEGVLSQTNNVMTFTRDYPGQPVTVQAGKPFYTVEGESTRNRTATIWVGRNDDITAPDAATKIVARIGAMLDYFAPRFKRVLVMEIAPWAYEPNGHAWRTALNSVNQAIKDAFPQYWLGIATYLRTQEAATAAGISFTAQDNTDIASGVTPSSFRYDDGHPNAAGDKAIAAKIYAEGIARGWLPRYVPPAPPVTLKSLYLPESWNAATITWEDATGNGNDIKAASISSAPTKVTEGSTSYLKFETSDNLSSTAFNVPQPFTVYGLMRVNAYPSTARAVMVNLSTGSNAMWAPSIHASGAVSVRSGTADIETVPALSPLDTGWHGHGAVFNGAFSLAELDGTEFTGPVTQVDGATRIGVATGNSSVTANEFLNADIAAIAIAPTALSTMERANLLTYLKAQVGIA